MNKISAILLLLVISLLLSSCQGKPEFDLLEINFQKNNVFTVVKDEKHATYPNYVSTRSEKILYFNGVELYKEHPKQTSNNFIVFYYKEQNKEVFYYSVHIGHITTGKALLKSLNKQFGPADYRGFEGGTVIDFENTAPYKYIWEDKKDNRLFILTFHGTNQVDFNVMVNPTRSEEITGMAGAAYWNDFVDERTKNHDASYTYSQYIKDEMKEPFPSIPTKLTRGKVGD